MTNDDKCNALMARIDALQTLLNEREDRTKERFAAMDKQVNAALASSDKAVNKAELATEKRFEGVNEFRETLRDQAATLMPRVEYNVQHRALEDLVSNIAERMTVMENRQLGSKASLGQLGGLIIGGAVVAGAIGTLISQFLHH